MPKQYLTLAEEYAKNSIRTANEGHDRIISDNDDDGIYSTGDGTNATNDNTALTSVMSQSQGNVGFLPFPDPNKNNNKNNNTICSAANIFDEAWNPFLCSTVPEEEHDMMSMEETSENKKYMDTSANRKGGLDTSANTKSTNRSEDVTLNTIGDSQRTVESENSFRLHQPWIGEEGGVDVDADNAGGVIVPYQRGNDDGSNDSDSINKKGFDLHPWTEGEQSQPSQGYDQKPAEAFRPDASAEIARKVLPPETVVDDGRRVWSPEMSQEHKQEEKYLDSTQQDRVTAVIRNVVTRQSEANDQDKHIQASRNDGNGDNSAEFELQQDWVDAGAVTGPVTPPTSTRNAFRTPPRTKRTNRNANSPGLSPISNVTWATSINTSADAASPGYGSPRRHNPNHIRSNQGTVTRASSSQLRPYYNHKKKGAASVGSSSITKKRSNRRCFFALTIISNLFLLLGCGLFLWASVECLLFAIDVQDVPEYIIYDWFDLHYNKTHRRMQYDKLTNQGDNVRSRSRRILASKEGHEPNQEFQLFQQGKHQERYSLRRKVQESTSVLGSEWLDSNWEDLPPLVQAHASNLGYDQRSWDNNLLYPDTYSTSWGDLGPLQQVAAAVLFGYSQEEWDGEFVWVWGDDKANQMDPNNNGIADEINATNLSTDDWWENDNVNATDNKYNNPSSWANYSWRELPQLIRKAAGVLGFNEEIWDNVFKRDKHEEIKTLTKFWDQLSESEKYAAIVFGYNKVAWDKNAYTQNFNAIEYSPYNYYNNYALNFVNPIAGGGGVSWVTVKMVLNFVGAFCFACVGIFDCLRSNRCCAGCFFILAGCFGMVSVTMDSRIELLFSIIFHCLLVHCFLFESIFICYRRQLDRYEHREQQRIELGLRAGRELKDDEEESSSSSFSITASKSCCCPRQKQRRRSCRSLACCNHFVWVADAFLIIGSIIAAVLSYFYIDLHYFWNNLVAIFEVVASGLWFIAALLYLVTNLARGPRSTSMT